MASKIEQLIVLLDVALRDHDAGNGPMPHSRLTEAADDEHRAQVRDLRADVEAAKGLAEHDAEHRGWLRGNDWNARERDNAIRLRDEMCGERDEARADAERVRRGARCLRERCRRLEARARAVEEAHRAFLDAAYERGRRFREALTRAKRCIDERVCVMGMSKEEA